MSKPGQGRKILGYDRYDQPRRQDDPNALAAFDADKDDFLRGPSGRKAQSPSAPAAVFYLEKCPPVLDHKGFSSAAAAMRFWLTQPGFQKPTGPNAKDKHRVR